MKFAAVDLFCGGGGLTIGFQRAGISVVEGIDIDESCRFPYEKNTTARFILCDVQNYMPDNLIESLKNYDYKILTGCAPCQPFSNYKKKKQSIEDNSHSLLGKFSSLACESNIDIVAMENVWGITKSPALNDFIKCLENNNFKVSFNKINCVEYGIPQKRIRLVLLASRKGKIKILPASHPNKEEWKTVQDTISHLPVIKAGEIHSDDHLHRSSKLSSENTRRIIASTPGKSWREWHNKNLILPCHRKKTGQSYPDVYGRMEWSKPSPTITGQCWGFGNGRFGHPQQDRAISLREAALLQTFPKDYQMVPQNEIPPIRSSGKIIGNAVPPKLGEVIGKSITEHLFEHC